VSSYPERSPKAKLKLVAGARPTELRLGGRAPTDEVTPGKYLVRCEAAWLEPKGKTTCAALQFTVRDGKHDSVAFRLWVTASGGGGIVSPTSRYGRFCALALGRALESDDPVGDPHQIFSGKSFLVQVGYRKTNLPRGGMASDENSSHRKDEQDFLRVHEILSREDL
jgi:hypothetical protein